MRLTGKIQGDLKAFSAGQGAVRFCKAPRIWVMVVDRHVASVFEKSEHGIRPVGEAFPDIEEHAFANKSIGRIVSSSGSTPRHKYEPHMNAERQGTLSFARQISEFLDRAVEEDAFDRLILAAAPQVLGELRHVLKHPVRMRVTAEINKDLTRMGKLALQAELEKTADAP